MTDIADDIKVEVQLPPEIGDNLLTNTSGQYGAWQWAAGSTTTGLTITGNPVGRTITATRNAIAGYTTVQSDYVPVTPGRYVNARVDLTAITAGHKVTLAIQFYDSAYVVHSWQYSSPSSALATLAFSSVSVPAGVSWVKLFVILDKTADPLPGAGSANANASVTFTKAMVTELTSSGVPSVVVTNLMPNGGFQTSTTGWVAGTNISGITRVDTGGGAWVLHAVLDSGVTLSDNEKSYVNGPYVTVEPGENYSIRVDVRCDVMTSGHSLTPGLLYRWFNSSNVQVGADVILDSSVTTGAWVQFWRIVTPPAGATKLRFFPYMKHHGAAIVMGSGWDFEVDSVSVVKSSVLMPYFDGSTPDTSSHVYDWTGTVGNSASTRTSVGAVDYVEPDEQFIDISGGYNQFTIERDELDISTMNGIVVDPALSPARADSVISPGRGVRVWAMRPGVGFTRLFTGTLGPSSVEYDPLEDEKRQKVKISVSAVGRESTLAQASRPEVALTAAGLPDLALSQAGVPWDVDGSTGITDATSVATNDNATALDQVALTRDTVGGVAWVDPTGVIRFRTTLGAKSTGPATMGPADYSAAGLKVGFSTDNLINQVLVTRLIRASDGSTEERTAGQVYEDGASVRKWGAHSAPLTIASTPSATTDAATAAQRILTGNATPTIAIEEVAINSADERDHAFHDLFDLITVTAETIDGTVVKALRVARIRHEFTTERRPRGQGRWHTTYGFKVNGTVASPSIQPPVASPATTYGRHSFAATHSNGSITNGAWYTLTGFATALPGFSSTDIESIGTSPVTYASGNITAVTDVWMEVDLYLEIENNSTGRRGIRITMDGVDTGQGISGNFQTALSATPMRLYAHYSGPLATGHQLRLQAYQDSGATRTTPIRELRYTARPLGQ